MDAVHLDLTSDALPPLKVIRCIGREAMNEISSFELDFEGDDGALDLDGCLGATATLTYGDALEATTRHVALIVVEANYEGPSKGAHRYRLRLASPHWVLGRRAGYRVFVDQTTQEIVTKVLLDAGFQAAQVSWRLSGNYFKRPQCVMYDETQLDFVRRLLADEGMSFWFEHDESAGPKLVIADDIQSHEGIEGSTALPFRDKGLAAFRCFFELECALRWTTTGVHVRDYDIRAPDVLIDGKAGEPGPEYFEYPAGVVSSKAAGARAAVRLDQLRREEETARGRTDCMRVQPGRLLTIRDCADSWMDRKYLVTGVTHSWSAFVDGARGFEAFVEMVPASTRAHRPPISKSRPRVAQIEPAMTTGPSGEEIHVDDLGRLKIRYPWDRANVEDDKSSYWVRCMQMSMGNSMLLPRVGWEVPVVYFDGDPDRPFVLGRLYNGKAVVPYGLPGASATTTLQSATSPGGGSTNEIRMGDSAGGQEVFVHASKDQTVTVGGSSTHDVASDETHDVGLALQIGISGSQTLTVGASQTVDVAMTFSQDIAGSRSETVGGMEMIKTTGNRKIAIGGAYTELIGAAYGLQSNQSNTIVKGAFTQLIGAVLDQKAGMGTGETVHAARTKLVGASCSVTAAKVYVDKVLGAKTVVAGACKEDGDAGIATDVKAAGSVKIGASAKMTAGGKFTIEAPDVTIDVGATIKAGPMKIGGGTLTAKSGKTNLKGGTIKRSGGGKVGS